MIHSMITAIPTAITVAKIIPTIASSICLSFLLPKRKDGWLETPRLFLVLWHLSLVRTSITVPLVISGCKVVAGQPPGGPPWHLRPLWADFSCGNRLSFGLLFPFQRGLRGRTGTPGGYRQVLREGDPDQRVDSLFGLGRPVFSWFIRTGSRQERVGRGRLRRSVSLGGIS